MRRLVAVLAMFVLVLAAVGCSTVGGYWHSDTVQSALQDQVMEAQDKGVDWVVDQVNADPDIPADVKDKVVALLTSEAVREYVAQLTVNQINDLVDSLVDWLAAPDDSDPPDAALPPDKQHWFGGARLRT